VTTLAPVAPAPPPALARRAATGTDDPSLRLADRLLRDSGVAGPYGLLYRDNVATYLFHALGARRVQRLLEESRPVTLETVKANLPWLATGRWVTKLERELQAPYTDSQVFDRLEELEGLFRDEVVRLRQAAGGQKVRILVQGSLCKGRLGARSDIDARVDCQDPALHQRLARVMPGWPKEHVATWLLPASRAEERVEEILMGPRLDLGDGAVVLADEHVLTRYYLGVMRQKGYDIGTGPDGRPTVTALPRVPRRRETGLLAEKLYALTHPSRVHSIGRAAHLTRRVLATVAGGLLPLPGLGPLLRRGLEWMVPGPESVPKLS
jgi:hypothetical protein